MANFIPYSHSAVTKTGEKIAARVRGLAELEVGASESTKPILVLIHGYPQTSYSFRELVPLLPKDLPLYIPDIPGYGESTATASTSFAKLNLGVLVLDALLQLLPTSPRPYPIIIIGHDRGARIAQSLAHNSPITEVSIKGTVLLDIAPVPEQWTGFSNPAQSVKTFHWPFLAAPYPIPEEMIGAYGGAKFAKGCIERWSGNNEERKAVVLKNFEEYAESFDRPETIHATCEDYRAGSKEDYEELERVKKEGKKIKYEALLVYSEAYLAGKYGVPDSYAQYVEDGKFTVVPIGNGSGHFVAEEQPEAVAKAINEWLEKRVGIKSN